MGEHLLGQRSFVVDWSPAAVGVTRDEPDRSDLGYIADVRPGTGRAWRRSTGSARPRFATRTFSTLNENNWDLGGQLAAPAWLARPPVALEGRRRLPRPSTAMRTSAPTTSSTAPGRSERQQAAGADLRRPEHRRQQPSCSTQRQRRALRRRGPDHRRLRSKWSSRSRGRLQLIGGARLEQWHLNVASWTTQGRRLRRTRDNTDILPSLALNYPLTEDQNLRFSATQTLSRPEYRELSPIAYFEQVGLAHHLRQSGPERALIQNFDLRWEWFPAPGEVLSVGVFAKHFD